MPKPGSLETRGAVRKNVNRKSIIRRDTAVIVIGILIVTGLHYASDTRYLLLHETLQRFYYLPIIYAAYRYGLRGGLATSLFSGAVYLPHVYFHWPDLRVYALSQFWEIILFQCVAVVTGLLSNAERKARQKSEETAERLSNAYGELQSTVEQLIAAERMASIAQLSLSLVHEVRNPLGAIRGAAEALEPSCDPGEGREFLAIIHTEVNRLNRLVSDFLEFGRPRAPEKMPTPPNEVIRSVATLVRKRAEQQGVTIGSELADSLPLILTDAEQIKQALVNLALNALDAMPEGGELRFATFLEEDEVVFLVADTGPGLPPKVRQNLFRPFLTTKAKGTGLGLPISQRLVTQNGGTIGLCSAEGAGTTFQIRIKP
jgi:two-component system, NtrC family, sensor histidine kinase HydH